MLFAKAKTDFLEYLEIEQNRSQKTIQNYDHYLTRLLDFAMAGPDPMADMRRAMDALRRQPPAMLAGLPVHTVRDYRRGVDGLPPSDVLAFANERGKAIVRPSGTEPKVKIYLSAPGQTEADTEQALAALEADARGWLA